MKVPARRWLILLPLLTLAAWLAVFGDKTPPGQARERLVRAGPVEPNPAPIKPSFAIRAIDEPIGRLLARREIVSQTALSGGHDLFATAEWLSPAPAPAPGSAITAAPPSPTLPDFPFTVIGKKFEDGAWEVYLTRDSLSFIALPGSTLDGAYRVDKIDPPTMTVTHLPTGLTQAAMIGELQ